MNLAKRLLQDPQSKDGTCIDLVRATFSEDDRVPLKTDSLLVGRTTAKLRIAKLLLNRNLLSEAQTLLSDLDYQAYVVRAHSDWQILLCFRLLIWIGKPGRALDLVSSVLPDRRIDPSTRSDIYLSIADGFLNRNQQDQASAIMDELDPDHVQNKFHLSTVYGRLGYYEQAIETVKEAYIEDNCLQDGYARLGWVQSKTGDWLKAQELMEKDLSAERISPPWQVNLAQIYGNLGFFEKAEQLIAQAYAKDASLQNGYSRLGWIRVVSSYRNLNKAAELMGKDLLDRKMSDSWQKNFVLLTAFLGRFNDVSRFVEKAYAEDLNLCDLYGHIGWGGFLCDYNKERFLELIDRDRLLNRSSIQGKVFEAHYQAAAALANEAVRKVEEAYQEKPTFTNLFSGIGWHFFRVGDIATCCELMRRDWIEGRMTVHWQINYVAALSASGRGSEAQRILGDAWALNQHEDWVVLGFPLSPNTVMSRSQYMKLLTKDSSVIRSRIFQTANQK